MPDEWVFGWIVSSGFCQFVSGITRGVIRVAYFNSQMRLV